MLLYWQAKVADDLNACMSIIRLLALQCQLLKQSASRVVNLTQDEAMAFVKSCTKYSEVTLMVVFLSIAVSHTQIVTFRLRHSRSEMYIGHDRVSVYLSVRRCIRTLLHGPGCKLGNGRGAL